MKLKIQLKLYLQILKSQLLHVKVSTYSNFGGIKS